MAEVSVPVVFGEEIDEVDLRTFTDVMLDYADVVRACGKAIDPNTTIDVNIKATKPGCLIAELALVANGLGGLFSDPVTALATLGNAVTIAGGVYAVAKHLSKHGAMRGSKEGDDGKTTIEAEDGAKTSVPTASVNVYIECPPVTRSIRNTFSVLEENGKVTSIRIGDDAETGFSATAEDFPDLAQTPEYETPLQKTVTETHTLTVIKPVLVKSTKRRWEFVMGGAKVSANISDEDFIADLEKRSFQVGTVIEADVDIHKEYSPEYRTYLNASYTISHVKSVNPPAETPEIF